MVSSVSRKLLASVLLGLLTILSGCQTMHGQFSSRQVKALTAAGFHETARGYEYVFPERLLFDVDKSELMPDQIPSVEKMGHLLVDLHIPVTAVEGHTDSSGTPEYNITLSQRRARSVGDELLATGYPPERLSVIGLGEAYPVDNNDTEEGRRENRRVVILVTAN
nr:OmpA family protein [uncultured Sphingomonas sp.]